MSEPEDEPEPELHLYQCVECGRVYETARKKLRCEASHTLDTWRGWIRQLLGR